MICHEQNRHIGVQLYGVSDMQSNKFLIQMHYNKENMYKDGLL